MPGRDDDELCIRATAGEIVGVIDAAAMVRKVVARSGVGGMIESASQDPLFEFDVPASSLTPGVYTCQVNVIDDAAGTFTFPRIQILVRR